MIGPADIEAWREEIDETVATESPQPASERDPPRRRLVPSPLAQGVAEFTAWQRRLFGHRN
ncbi:MAG: hypothetical protein GX458_00670 [Phyllobacteriaceae bacterium]|nr:hypothetical protein [Phyllobacteriaceae bacterium]